MKKLFLPERDIINSYLRGISVKILCKKYSTSVTPIYKVLNKHNIKLKNASESARRYPTIETFFDKMDTPEKAYFLGILYADGNNSLERNSIVLSLEKSDKYLLEKLSSLIFPEKRKLAYLESKISIKTINGRHINANPAYRLLISSKHMSAVLKQYGMGKDKTHNLIFPNWLHENLLPHFIRGYFDGDGSISIEKKRKEAMVEIVSTENFINKAIEVIKRKVGINVTEKKHTSKGIKQLRISGNRQVLKFLNWMYRDSTLHLTRKYIKYKELEKIRKNTEDNFFKRCAINKNLLGNRKNFIASF